MTLKGRHRWGNRHREDEKLGTRIQVHPIPELCSHPLNPMPLSEDERNPLIVLGGCNLPSPELAEK